MAVKPEKHSFFKRVRIYFNEYCNNTSIHGFKYFGEKRSYCERGWWFIVFTISLTACFFAISMVYQKWVKSPVIVTFATMETPIYSIPFPAVTICPESKSRQKVYSHRRIIDSFVNNNTIDKTDLQKLKYMGLLCDPDSDINYPQDRFIGDSIYHTFKELGIRSPFIECSFLGQEFNCATGFIPIITDEGICYTFNAADRSEIFQENVVHYANFHDMKKLINKEWTIEDGYSENSGLETYPRRALLSGIGNALSVLLGSTYLDIDETCKRGNQGFKVSLHLPTRIPRPSQEYFSVPNNEVVIAGIQPNMIKTSGRVKGYDIKKRNCYFSYERELKYFKIYTPKNCKMECLTNFTLYYCGCVGFFMPRENSTNICGSGSLKCMKYAETKSQLSNLQQIKGFLKNNTFVNKISWADAGKYFSGDLFPCSCLPTCSDLIYHVESSQSKWDWFTAMAVHYKNNSIPFNTDIMKLSQLIVFFKTSEFIFSERNELYGPLDFLANFGGLLGLFTGFSLLSLMEAFYFLTLRMFCNSRMYGSWSGKDSYAKQ